MPSRRYLPHPLGVDTGANDAATQMAGWRARRDACRPMAEVMSMPPVRRARALAVIEAARAMLGDGTATPCGHVAALRVSLAVPHGGDPAEDWAERHRERERERMRRRIEAGDPKLMAERLRQREREHTPEGRAKRAEWDAARCAARKARRAEAEMAAALGRAAAMAELQAALAELKATAGRLGVAPPGAGREGV